MRTRSEMRAVTSLSQGLRSAPRGSRRSKVGLRGGRRSRGIALPHAPAHRDGCGYFQLPRACRRSSSRRASARRTCRTCPSASTCSRKKDMQNLGISGFDDYAQKVPSISFISEGPGTQFFVMRGVSDGSNPNYSNTSATGIFHR